MAGPGSGRYIPGHLLPPKVDIEGAGIGCFPWLWLTASALAFPVVTIINLLKGQGFVISLIKGSEALVTVFFGGFITIVLGLLVYFFVVVVLTTIDSLRQKIVKITKLFK